MSKSAWPIPRPYLRIKNTVKHKRKVFFTFSNVQVGIVLVGEVCLESLHSAGLVRVADGHQLVRVAAAAACQPNDFTESAELRPNIPEGFRVQVQKGDAERQG